MASCVAPHGSPCNSARSAIVYELSIDQADLARLYVVSRAAQARGLPRYRAIASSGSARPWSGPVSGMATDSPYIYAESVAVLDSKYEKQGVFG